MSNDHHYSLLQKHQFSNIHHKCRFTYYTIDGKNIYFENQSDPEKSIAAYQKLIELNPDSLEADFFQFTHRWILALMRSLQSLARLLFAANHKKAAEIALCGCLPRVMLIVCHAYFGSKPGS